MEDNLSETQKKKLEHRPLTQPFENIALAFSGGGFRAASFALGVLSYLDSLEFDDPVNNGAKTKLLHKVTYLSSASGGTIATALYSLYNTGGESFEKYYLKLFGSLKDDGLLKEALSVLNSSEAWKERPLKNRNLINSFATVYDSKLLFDGASIKDIIPGAKPSTTHLQEVCFNTTEFFHGLLFKQQVKLQPDKREEGFLYGNFTIHLENDAAGSLKLGDLLAASSCFPAGFEAIVFPDDFLHGDEQNSRKMHHQLLSNLSVKPQKGDTTELEFIYDEKELKILLKDLKPPLTLQKLQGLKLNDNFKIGFMDGGITDNQGLESMMLANARRLNGDTSFTPFDLMLVSDVGSHFMDPYLVPTLGKKSFLNLLNINKTRVMLWLLLFAGAAGAYCIHHFCESHLHLKTICTGISIALSAVAGITLLAPYIIELLAGKTAFNLEKNFSPSIMDTLKSFLKKTPLRVFIEMVKTRATSILIMNNDVFLKRIRYLLYNEFYNEPAWTNRGKGNHVYDLSFSNDFNRTEQGSFSQIEPSSKLQIVAEAAFSMATTLWFDKNDMGQNHMEACIIACGQFTTCYNLLEYIYRLEKSEEYAALDPGYKQRVMAIKEKLENDYKNGIENFMKDPFWLYNQLGKKYKIENFKEVNAGDFPFPENYEGLRIDKPVA